MSQMKTVTKMSKDQWHKERDKGLGGSDCAAALGQNRWKSPYTLWLEKTGRIERFKGNRKTEIGLEVEEAIFQMTKKRLGSEFELDENGNLILTHDKAFDKAKEKLNQKGLDVLHNNQFFRSDKYPWMIGNIDGDIYDPETESWGVLEIKFTSPFLKKEWEGEEIPQEYILQLQHYFIVTERDWGFLAVLIGNEDFILKRVERDEELCQMIIDGEKDFWDCVVNKTPPAIDGAENTKESLKELYPAESTEPDAIRLPEDAKNLCQTREEIRQQIKELDEMKTEVENKIKDLLGEHEVGLVDDWEVHWKPRTQNKFNLKKFKKDKKKLYEQYLEEKETRYFTMKQKKEE
ncbi:MAG: YqaJ viral recombinase family protein [Petrotogales bacterium]